MFVYSNRNTDKTALHKDGAVATYWKTSGRNNLAGREKHIILLLIRWDLVSERLSFSQKSKFVIFFKYLIYLVIPLRGVFQIQLQIGSSKHT